MSRYFTSDQQERQNNPTTSRINLPEFIPLDHDKKDNSIPQHSRLKIPSTSRNQQQQQNLNHQTSSPSSNYRNLDHSSNPRQRSRSRESRNGRERRSSKESYRSNRSYDDYKNCGSSSMIMQNRTRSRSPQYLSPPREDYRERNMQTSVFDRMSSPPQRKHESSRRSIESNFSERRGYNGGLQILRTVNGDDRINQTVDSRFQIDLSQYEVQQRYVAEPRSLAIEETMELRNMRERLIAAEAHCYGLETTVKNYEREIFKLRTIVNTLIDDFEVVQTRLR